MTIDVEREVKRFYVDLPFNFSQSEYDAAEYIKKNNSLEGYYPLNELLAAKRLDVIDVGCGPGWLALNMAHHFHARVTGIDFNPIAIERAQRVANLLECDAKFIEANIFEYKPEKRSSLVISMGVLHHTSDCHGAILRLAENYLAPQGLMFIGLYHQHGRKPFLEYFRNLKNKGYTEEELLMEYARLDNRFEDDPVHLRSWFRDQVLHPHETQHTLHEIYPTLKKAGLEIIGTSLNRYKKINNINKILDEEIKQKEIARKMLDKGVYFPGFFTFLAKKID